MFTATSVRMYVFYTYLHDNSEVLVRMLLFQLYIASWDSVYGFQILGLLQDLFVSSPTHLA